MKVRALPVVLAVLLASCATPVRPVPPDSRSVLIVHCVFVCRVRIEVRREIEDEREQTFDERRD